MVIKQQMHVRSFSDWPSYRLKAQYAQNIYSYHTNIDNGLYVNIYPKISETFEMSHWQ